MHDLQGRKKPLFNNEMVWQKDKMGHAGLQLRKQEFKNMPVWNISIHCRTYKFTETKKIYAYNILWVVKYMNK